MLEVLGTGFLANGEPPLYLPDSDCGTHTQTLTVLACCLSSKHNDMGSGDMGHAKESVCDRCCCATARALQIKLGGKCVDVEYGSLSDGVAVSLHDYNGQDNQLFGFTVFGDGHRIIAKHSKKVSQEESLGALSVCERCGRRAPP